MFEAKEETSFDYSASPCKEKVDSMDTTKDKEIHVRFDDPRTSLPEEHTIEQTTKSTNEKRMHFNNCRTPSPEVYTLERANLEYAFILPLACYTSCACSSIDSADSDNNSEMFYAE